MRRALLLAMLATVTAGCGAEEVGPIARIELTPESLCEGAPDTPVIVSGKSSVGVDGTSEGLSFSWSFSREPAGVVRGGAKEPEIVVEFSTRAAVRVELEVRDARDRGATRERVLGLTRTARVPCAHGCANHETCVAFSGEELCVDDRECTEDTECGCLSCRPDDLGTGRCVAP